MLFLSVHLLFEPRDREAQRVTSVFLSAFVASWFKQILQEKHLAIKTAQQP